MRAAMDETERRRARQLAWNAEHGIVPKTVSKSLESPLDSLYGADAPGGKNRRSRGRKENSPAEAMPEKPEDIAKLIGTLEKDMRSAARDLEFEKAAELRDCIRALRERLYLGGDALEDRAEAVAMQEPASAMGRKAGRRERAEAEAHDAPEGRHETTMPLFRDHCRAQWSRHTAACTGFVVFPDARGVGVSDSGCSFGGRHGGYPLPLVLMND